MTNFGMKATEEVEKMCGFMEEAYFIRFADEWSVASGQLIALP